jgi:hypothetical protein
MARPQRKYTDEATFSMVLTPPGGVTAQIIRRQGISLDGRCSATGAA